MWKSRPPAERLPKGNGKTARKVGLNLKERMAKKGGQSSHKLVTTKDATPGEGPLNIKNLRKLPSWTHNHSHVGLGMKT